MDSSFRRRDFLKYSAAAAAAAGLPLNLMNAGQIAAADAVQSGNGTPATKQPPANGTTAYPRVPHDQKMNADFQSNNDGTEYYFLGNGLITAALQTTQSADAGTQCGLLLMSPEHFGRKASTFLFHPERGLQNSLFNVVVNGSGYTPKPGTSKVSWAYPASIPTVVIEWHADACAVREELYCPINEPALVRTVAIRNTSNAPAKVLAYCSLYPNLMLFDEYTVDRTHKTLSANGFTDMHMFSPDTTRIGDRQLYFDCGEMAPGASVTMTIVLTIGRTREEFQKTPIEELRKETTAYWSSAAQVHTKNELYDHLFRVSQSSLRAAVARSGKMDGGIWQYNLEWVRDQSMVASACAMMGRADIAESLLRRILTHSIDDQGGTVDASRTRPPETMELDQNGELLYALWIHWAWTGSDALIREYWKKIQLLADYVLKPVYRDPAIGLLKNSREYWERDASFGVKDGYELTYQMWNIIGLGKAAEIADAMKESESAQRWRGASALMKSSFLSHPTLSLVHENRFIKRRNADGTPQFTFEPKNRKSMPPGMPLNVETVSYCDPDSASVLPIVLDMVDPKGTLAANTLKSMELLWNQQWTIGGYGRYHVSSEGDSPGPWPFATMFIARASLEAGNDEQVVRALEWLGAVKGGASGAWLEFYGDRPVPPLPPVGIVVWTWAEIVMFFMHHVLGARPSPTQLVLRPKLFKGIDALDAVIPVHGAVIGITVRRAAKDTYALVDGTKTPLKDGTLTLAFPVSVRSIEMFV
jgi:TAT (twin-arginine translocation) pathway signal sequence